jgi:hypothetical protein
MLKHGLDFFSPVAVRGSALRLFQGQVDEIGGGKLFLRDEPFLDLLESRQFQVFRGIPVTLIVKPGRITFEEPFVD